MWPLFIGMFVLLVFYGILGRYSGLFMGVVAAFFIVIVPLINRLKHLQRQLDDVSQALARLSDAVAKKNSASPARDAGDQPLASPHPGPTDPISPVPPDADAAREQSKKVSFSQNDAPEQGHDEVISATEPRAREPRTAWARQGAQGAAKIASQSHLDEFIQRALAAIKSYFTDGNVFVRIGIVVMFFGVAFLLKYAAQSDLIPLEFRFIGAAMLGLAVLGVGWRMRAKRRVYALLLQGAGIGITYITIFSAFRLAHLLPQSLAFFLLVFFAIFTVMLAVLQDSKHLAFYALVGGFIAPLLVSSGQGNYIALFSYYTGLNGVVFALAWFRAWRALNLLGFGFTFFVFGAWTLLKYEPQMLWPATAFLLVFFLMYSMIGVLYALGQPDRMTGVVDGTLVFGTPVIVSGLLMVIFRNAQYGVAIISAGLGLYYVMLARYTWHRVDPALKLLAEALLAIGIVFATLAIPYTLEGHWSSASWALEAAGILWVALRQQRLYAQLFAIALQFAAGLLFLVTVADEAAVGMYAGGAVIAAGGFVSARLLYLLESKYRLRGLHGVFFVWGMLWWLWSAATAIEYFELSRRPSLLLVLVATACALVALDRVRAWHWRPAAITAAGLLPILMLFAFEYLLRYGHVLRYPDALAWGVALVACYWVIWQLEGVPWRPSITLASHTGYVLFLSSVLSVELFWGLAHYVEAKGEGFAALIALCPLLAFRMAYNASLPAQRRLGEPLRRSLLLTLGVVLSGWSVLSNVGNTGAVDPLPYLPFLNPVDLLQFLFFSFAALCLLGPKRISVSFVQPLKILLGALIFIWLTFVLLRSLHHYLDIPYRMHSLLRDVRVHMCLSILWTLMGMAIMLIASKRFGRGVWLVGAGLVTVVLAKMFFVDLAASGTVERIVTCLVVGGLLMTTGYFAPAPARQV